MEAGFLKPQIAQIAQMNSIEIRRDWTGHSLDRRRSTRSEYSGGRIPAVGVLGQCQPNLPVDTHLVAIKICEICVICGFNALAASSRI
jgi:hypothetical protein